MADDMMQQPWCCLTCFARFTFGKLRVKGPDILCPNCRSTNIHPATGSSETLSEYHGAIEGLKQ